jgi:hypothetical protein
MFRRTQGRAITLLLLASGVIALTYSLIATSTILAFIGLGLTFWGALLLYVTNERYVPQDLLSLTTISSLLSLNQMLNELNYRGSATYLPPQYFTTADTKVRFIKGDLQQLIQTLPKLLIEDLEITENLEITLEPSEVTNRRINSELLNPTRTIMIHVKMTNSIYEDISKEVVNPSMGYPLYRIGCPIFSALACTLAKTTGKPITIERMNPSDDGKAFEATFRILEPEGRVVELVKLQPLVQRVSPISLLLTASGAIMLAWVGWLIWNDLTTWGKDLALILFGFRTGEAMSLGLGVTAIHYLLVGGVLLALGLLTLQRNIFQAIRKKLKFS